MILARGGINKEEFIMSNKNYDKTSSVDGTSKFRSLPDKMTDERIDEIEVTPATTEEPSREIRIGTVANCARLRVRNNPNLNGEEMYSLKVGTDVEIDLLNSTDEFYLIRTSSGCFDGYCMKKYIDIKD